MQSLLAVPLSILTTAICWGTYGVLLKWGAEEMGDSRLRPFICLGLAYFAIAVVVPFFWLKARGEKGTWSFTGTLWSLIAGALGALGALGIVLALTFGGAPIYVMPLVFGGAPVINTVTHMAMTRNYKVNPFFLAGLILVIAGAVLVLINKPAVAAAAAGSGAKPGLALEFLDWVKIVGSILLTVVSWGAYGPTLHKGQMAMQGSRLRPLICVGLSYFVIAVLIPGILYPLLEPDGTTHGGHVMEWTMRGVLWSLAGGTAGAIGALGIILAFTFGGKPSYVMPLVFGGAPIVNTFFSLSTDQGTIQEISPFFYSGLIIAIIGAVCVLLFAPKGGPHGQAPASKPAATAEPAAKAEPVAAAQDEGPAT